MFSAGQTVNFFEKFNHDHLAGNPVWCNLCRPFGNEPTPEECSADSEYGMECQLCYQLSGPGSFLRETCVPVSQYMVTSKL